MALSERGKAGAHGFSTAPPDGFVFTEWGSWSAEDAKATLARAQNLGARHVTFLVHLGQDDPIDGAVGFADPGGCRLQRTSDFGQTEQRRRLEDLLPYVADLGLETGLLPLVLLSDHTKRDWVVPTRAWFGSYAAALVSLAGYAESWKVDELVVGSELTFAFLRRRAWSKLVARVRKVFHGHLLASPVSAQYPLLRFDRHLDSLGLSAYFPLASRAEPDLALLVRRWRLHRAHLEWVARVKGKALTFQEVGYPAMSVAARRPWSYAYERWPAHPELQARCFEAFSLVWADASRLRAFRIWGLSMAPHPKSFDVLGRPAEQAVRALLERRARLVVTAARQPKG